VGTKVEIAARTGRYRGVGADIVNHCINDVLVQGAKPLFFLDYVASSKLRSEMVAEIVEGMASACKVAECALLGGETAEMPGVYNDGAFDIAGTLVGVVDRAKLLPSSPPRPGDVLIGIASNGPHTNGYSLLRKAFEWMPLETVVAPLEVSLADALLEPHRNYLPVLERVLREDLARALVHITGGGLPDNLPRVLPENVCAVVEVDSWPVPPLFRLVREILAMDKEELYRTLNMGIGMVVVASPDQTDAVRNAIREQTWIIGRLEAGQRGVVLR
jgi:phosphoribosylaminoimidazole synthetase